MVELGQIIEISQITSILPNLGGARSIEIGFILFKKAI